MATLIKRPQAQAPAIQARGFVELIARTNFSFLQGASHPEEMVEEAIRLGYQGIGICDLNGLYGVVRGKVASRSPSLFGASVQAQDSFHYLIGTELTVSDESFLTLMPMNKNGYTHLCELLTLGKRQAAKGFSKLDLEQISKRSSDLLCFAMPPISDERYAALEDIFGDRLYIPVWKDLTWESQEHLNQALHLEEKFQAQLFVTQRPFMHHPERKPLFDILTCIHHHTTLEDARDKLIQNAERCLKSLSEISFLWQSRIDLVEKSVEIARRVDFTLDEIRYRYPQSSLPGNMTPTEYLRHLAYEGSKRRFPQGLPEKVRLIIEHELNIIMQLEYEDYFLTLKEICDFAQEKGILYQGRGSAANSVVCFCIGLTSVSPDNIDVLFERFLSLERREPPDIDIDFEHSRREEVIQHIYEKYNERHAAMVCTVVRFRSRMSMRETAKVFGMSLPNINAMIKFTGRDGISRLIDDPRMGERFGLSAHQWKLFLHLAHQLRGFPRHLGIHTGGFLITQDPITEMVPVEKATMNGRYVIQWNKDDVANLKLMKIDLLSLGMLTCLQKCFHLLKNHKGVSFNLATIPHDDKPTYDMIGRAETVGVFQIESRAQMNTLPRMKPRDFYDLVIEVALIRPGPLQGGMVHPYLRRRQGLEKVTYAHEELIPILKKTFGIPIFQEQVMRIAVVACGFSPGESDELRRIMSSAWRKRATMDGVRERIHAGMAKKGISLEYAEQIYKTIEGFANYGFPESHAASFALLTYASCYLKQHHPDVFLCSLLNSQPMGFYAPRTLISEAQRNHVQLLPLDVQKSDYDYTLEGTGRETELRPVRVGLRSVYGFQAEMLKRVEEERKIQPFADLKDFIRRTQLPKIALVKLAATGALDCFEESTRDLIWKIEGMSLDQNSFLWGHSKELSAENEEEMEDLPFESGWDKLRREYDTKGFSVTDHPLSILRSYLDSKNEGFMKLRQVPFRSSENLPHIRHKTKVRVAGLVGITQRPPTAKGMCFITLEDEFGFMNIVITPDVYQKYRPVVYGKSLLEVRGFIERVGDVINVRAESVLPLV